MGFPGVLSSGEKATLRASNYWSRSFLAVNPGEFVFQCQADETITDAPFIEFAWDNATVGSYADVYAGMVVYISATDEPFKDYKYRGRVRLAPDATTFFIDYNATTLNAGDYVTVIRDADLFARIRQGDLVDSEIAYHNLPPMITGLPSVLVLYDADNNGVVSYAAVQTGIAVASGATISAWLWTISGAGSTSFTSGSSTSQNPTIQFQAGYHYLVRCRVTDSNGVQHYMWVQVYAITRTFTAPVILPIVAGSVTQDLDNGYLGSVTAYGGVSTLPYRTHAAVFCVEHFGDNSSTPMVSNILMHGRLRSESITTEGSTEGGQLQQVTYPIEGITSYMQRLKLPNDIVRHSAAPDAWGEMVNPTPYRMAVYALFAYSTLLNLVSFSAGDSLFDAWRRGGEPVSVDGGYALDTLTTLLAFVDAAPNYAPDGEIRCEINASYKVDRSGLVTVMDWLAADIRAFTLDIDTSAITAQVIGYGGSWNTVNNTFVVYTALAPTVPYGDAPETRELTRLLLQYDLTVAQATAELAARTGNDYAFYNPKWLLNVTLRDSDRWLVATNYQRYTFTLAATYNLREIAINTGIKFQCQSVNITLNPDGTYDVTGEFPQETEFTDAQSVASLLPVNLEGMNPVMPILSDNLAFPDEPAWAYPTDTPTQDELMPVDAYSGYMSFGAMTPDQAAEAALKQGSTKCKTFQVLMRNTGTTNSPFLTVNAAPYTLKITGYGQISAGGWHQHINFVTSDGGFVVGVQGVYTPGVGWQNSFLQLGNGYQALDIGFTFPGTSTLLRAEAVFSYSAGTLDPSGDYSYGLSGSGGLLSGVLVPTVPTSPQAWTGSASSTLLTLYLLCGVKLGVGDPGGTVTLTSLTLDGTGENPFTATPGADPVFADWFHFWTEANPLAQAFGATAGGLLDGSKGLIPEYSPNHSYEVQYVGTGNALQAAFALSDYTDVQNRLITITACRNT